MAPPGGQQAAMPEMPKMPNMWPLLITMLVIFVLYGIDQWNFGDAAHICADGKAHNIGYYLNFVFGPLGFNGQFPVLTLMITGTVMVLLSSLLRTALTDTLAQQRATAYSSAFNKELREARMANNMYKVKKLQEMQPEVMAKSMESSGAMMKIMPWTMLIVVPMFLWVRFFVGDTLVEHGTLMIGVPWCSEILDSAAVGGGVDLSKAYVFPAWILVYSLVSIPIGQAVTRAVRYFQFKKKLAALDADSYIASDVTYTAPAETSVPAQPESVPSEQTAAEQAQDKQEPPKEGL